MSINTQFAMAGQIRSFRLYNLDVPLPILPWEVCREESNLPLHWWHNDVQRQQNKSICPSSPACARGEHPEVLTQVFLILRGAWNLMGAQRSPAPLFPRLIKVPGRELLARGPWRTAVSSAHPFSSGGYAKPQECQSCAVVYSSCFQPTFFISRLM